MNKLISLLLLTVLMLTFAFSAGQTLAYWVAEDSTVNLAATCRLSAEIIEDYEQNQIVYPGDIIEKIVNVKNTGNVDSIIRVKVSRAWGQVRENDELVIDSTLSTDNIIIDFDTEKWFFDPSDGYFYYKGVLAPKETTEKPLFTEFHIESSTDNMFANMHADIKIEMESIQAAHGAPSLWNTTLEELGIEYTPPKTGEGKTPIITFVDPESKFTFSSDSGSADVFLSWRQLLPGESRSQIMTLENSFIYKAPFFIKAEYDGKSNETEKQQIIDDLMKQRLTLTISDEDGNIVYSGALWGNIDMPDSENSMKDFIPLGELESKETKNYNVTLNVCPNLDSSYNEIVGEVKWVFKALGNSETIYPPQTGGISSTPFYASLMFLSGGMIILMIAIQRKSRRKFSR